MKKKESIFKKTIFIVFTIIFILFISGSFSSRTTANSGGIILIENNYLKNENTRLKKEYIKLNKKLKEIENEIDSIDHYDNVIYAQILGVDFDTTNFNKYRNDSASIVFQMNDSIFNNVSERSAYAAEMLALKLEKLKYTSKYLKNNKNIINYYPNVSPIKTKDFINLSSPYGWRNHPTEKRVLFHEGIDIAATPGTKVYSTAQGTIVKILYSKYGYGNRVVIKHAYGFETLYAHLDNIVVRRGEWVKKGQIIGTVGNTGRSTGYHLHYEIHKHNESRDPLGYFYTHITNELLAQK